MLPERDIARRIQHAVSLGKVPWHADASVWRGGPCYVGGVVCEIWGDWETGGIEEEEPQPKLGNSYTNMYCVLVVLYFAILRLVFFT